MWEKSVYVQIVYKFVCILLQQWLQQIGFYYVIEVNMALYQSWRDFTEHFSSISTINNRQSWTLYAPSLCWGDLFYIHFDFNDIGFY